MRKLREMMMKLIIDEFSEWKKKSNLQKFVVFQYIEGS